MAIPKGHRQNFNTLVEAARAGDVVLMECQLTATGEIVAVICAVKRHSNYRDLRRASKRLIGNAVGMELLDAVLNDHPLE